MEAAGERDHNALLFASQDTAGAPLRRLYSLPRDICAILHGTNPTSGTAGEGDDTPAGPRATRTPRHGRAQQHALHVVHDVRREDDGDPCSAQPAAHDFDTLPDTRILPLEELIQTEQRSSEGGAGMQSGSNAYINRGEGKALPRCPCLSSTGRWCVYVLSDDVANS